MKVSGYFLTMDKHLSIGKTRRLVNLPRSMLYYRSKKDISVLEIGLWEPSEVLPYHGLDIYFNCKYP